MRGQQKALVATLLVTSSSAAGALVGFSAGALWAATGLPALPAVAVTGLALAAVAADAVHARTGRMRPWSVGRQVPREWSALFSPATVAVLYGARLGAGPLTILRTHLWWVALVAGASAGPVVSTVSGVMFAAARTLIMVGIAEWARRHMPPRMASLRAAETAVAVAGALLLVLGGVLTLT